MMSDGNPTFDSPLWREGFTAVPNALFQADLSAQAKLLYACLLMHGFRKGRAWPGQPKLAAETGLSESSVKRALKELEVAAVLEILRRGSNKTNLYRLFPERLIGQSDLSGEVTVTSEEEEEEEEEDSPKGPSSGESKTSTAPVTSDIDRVWNHYTGKPGKQVRPLPDEERRVIRDALKVATADELCGAIDGCWSSDFHMKRGEFRDRNGQRYDKLSQIIRGRRGQETTRERIDFFLEVQEKTGVAGSGLPSADPAVIARRKKEVQRGHRFAGDPVAMRKAEEAEAWLRRHGIETIRDEHEDGFPTFRESEQGPLPE